MATITFTADAVKTFGDRAHVITWTPLTFSGLDAGSPVEMPGSADRSVQISGTFGAGGSVTLEGSNDGTNYVALTDPQGNAITKTAASLEAISELTRFVRPRVTAGDGTTSLTVSLLVKR